MKRNRTKSAVSTRSVARLSRYRSALRQKNLRLGDSIFSHQLAQLCGQTAAQVRQDLMAIGYTGSPSHGYDVERLLGGIDHLLDNPSSRSAAVVGAGRLGRALMGFFGRRESQVEISAVFDRSPEKTSRVFHGIRCYDLGEAHRIIREHSILIAILTTPAEVAQGVTDLLVSAGIRGLLNFAPVSLRVPATVFVEHIDMGVALDMVAYFTRAPQDHELDR